MDQNPSGPGQQQQHQPPKYDPNNGGHYGMLPAPCLVLGFGIQFPLWLVCGCLSCYLQV